MAIATLTRQRPTISRVFVTYNTYMPLHPLCDRGPRGVVPFQIGSCHFSIQFLLLEWSLYALGEDGVIGSVCMLIGEGDM